MWKALLRPAKASSTRAPSSAPPPTSIRWGRPNRAGRAPMNWSTPTRALSAIVRTCRGRFGAAAGCCASTRPRLGGGALPAVPATVRRPSPRRLGRTERRAARRTVRRRTRCSTTRGRAASGSSRCRTGRANSCPSARWCGWRCTSGSAGHRNRSRCTPPTPRRRPTMTCRTGGVSGTCRPGPRLSGQRLSRPGAGRTRQAPVPAPWP